MQHQQLEEAHARGAIRRGRALYGQGAAPSVSLVRVVVCVTVLRGAVVCVTVLRGLYAFSVPSAFHTCMRFYYIMCFALLSYAAPEFGMRGRVIK